MGQSTSNLAAQSQPGSALQVCLNGIFAGNTSSVSYPQDFLYTTVDVGAFNKRIPVIPAAVTRPQTNAQISAILACAVANDVKVAAKSGGHSYGNYEYGGTDNAVVVDMVNYQQFSMDTTTWQATIGSGTLLGDVTTRLSSAGGRAIAHGTCPEVGIGGHATIGGLGPLSRQWGAALDHVVGVEVVLANGTVVQANADQNPDVLWAIKGAAASFGVVTKFIVQTHPAPTSVTQFSYTVQLGKYADMVPTFKAWQSMAALTDTTLDRRLASELIILTGTLLITGTFFGTQEEYEATGFEKALAGNATSSSVVTIDNWLGVVGAWFENEALALLGGMQSAFYSKSLTFSNTTLIPDAGIDALFDYLDTANSDTLLWFVIFDLQGGATNDRPQSSTAFAHRDTIFYLQSYALHLTTMTNTTMDWVTGLSDTITNSLPGKTFGAYAGYVDPLLPDGPQQYWNTNLPKLSQIKSAIDPQDLFQNPQSVPLA